VRFESQLDAFSGERIGALGTRRVDPQDGLSTPSEKPGGRLA
jgi:hypothetical protein